MTFEECQQFLLYFLSVLNRSLTSKQQDLVFNVFRQTESPYNSLHWLNCIAQYVSKWKSFSQISFTSESERLRKMMTYKGNLMYELCNYFVMAFSLSLSLLGALLVFIEELEKTHGKLFVSHTLEYISASKSGLSENELLDILSQDKEV